MRQASLGIDETPWPDVGTRQCVSSFLSFEIEREREKSRDREGKREEQRCRERQLVG